MNTDSSILYSMVCFILFSGQAQAISVTLLISNTTCWTWTNFQCVSRNTPSLACAHVLYLISYVSYYPKPGHY